MYQGFNKTALCSQKQISDAFIRLLNQQSYASISISAICKEAEISRQTFYSLFESKKNLVIYILQKRYSFEPGQSCCQNPPRALSIADLSREYSGYIIDQKEFLTLLVKNDILYMVHDGLYDSLMECPQFMPGRSETNRRFGAEFLSGGLSGIARIYVENRDTPRRELEQTITDLFSGRIFLPSS